MNTLLIAVYSFAFYFLYEVITKVTFRYYETALKETGYRRNELSKSIASNQSWQDNYFQNLKTFLDKLSKHLNETQPNPAPTILSAFTVKSLDRCFRLAIIYPVLSIVFFWTFWGINTTGVKSSFLEQSTTFQRSFAFVIFVAALVVMLGLLKAKTYYKYNIAMMIGALALIGAYLTGADNYHIGLAILVATAFAFAAVYFYAFIGFFAIIVAIAGSLISSKSGGDVGSFWGPTVFISCCQLAYWADFKLKKWFGNERKFYCIFLPIFFILLIVVAWVTPHNRDPKFVFAFAVIYLGILPFLNAMMDWVSLSVTRWLLRHVVKQNSIQSMIISTVMDVVLAAFFLMILAVACTFTIAVINNIALLSSNDRLIDIGTIIFSIGNHPYHPSIYWIYFTLVTTFLPTILHLIVMAWACADLFMSMETRDWLKNLFESSKKSDAAHSRSKPKHEPQTFGSDALVRNQASFIFVLHRQIVPIFLLVLILSSLGFLVATTVGPWALQLAQATLEITQSNVNSIHN